MLCVAVTAILIYSCGKGTKNAGKLSENDLTLTEAKKEAPQQAGANDAMYADTTAASSSRAVSPPVPQSGSPINPDWDKKIIKTANLALELKDYQAYDNAIHLKVRSFGAYIAQEQQNETDDQITDEITIKVPVDKFDDLMNAFAGEGVKIVTKSISTDDATVEVVDTKARLEAKKQVRDRYMELLRQANNMKDLLEVQAEINGIQEDIESASGRVDYLVHAAAYSTINVKYYQFKNGITAKDTEPGFLSKTGEAFKTGGAVISNIVLFFVTIWPLTVAAIILLLYFKRWKVKKVKEENV